MILSKKSRYGLRALIDLSVSSKTEHMALNSIAQRNGISTQYLEQVFAALRRADIVKSIKGPQGGYLLKRPADEITVGDMLRCLEGKLDLVDCLSEESSCDRACACASRQVWKKLSNGLNQLADSITLLDMIQDQQCRTAQEG